MRDYAELVKALRCCAQFDAQNNGCDSCPYEYCGEDCQKLCGYAADGIEELLRILKDCRNELCLQCGAYKQRHMGVCDGCRWLTPPKEDAE